MTKMPSVKVLAIDDDRQDRRTAERLSRDGLVCVAISPPSTELIEEKVLLPLEQGKYDVVLLDFRLDSDSDPDKNPVSYRGGMLAAAIKERFPEIPIALVTTEEKHQRFVKGNPRIGNLFEHLLLKSAIGGDKASRVRAATEIRDLGLGVRRIREVVRRARSKDLWRPVEKLLDASTSEIEIVKDYLGGSAPEESGDIATWLLQELLAFPGPLLDAHEVRTRLGLSQTSFEKAEIGVWLARARYGGVFCELRVRWWEGRIIELLREASPVGIGQDAASRASAIAEASGSGKLTAAKCAYCGGGLVQRTCYLCGESVDAEHHLAARVDARPAWALPAVICFKCIEVGRDEENRSVRFGPGTDAVIQRLKSSAE